VATDSDQLSKRLPRDVSRIENLLRDVSRIEAFLKDVLRLEGETEAHIGECVRFHIAQHALLFRADQRLERNEDLATRVFRALCRWRIIRKLLERNEDLATRVFRALCHRRIIKKPEKRNEKLADRVFPELCRRRLIKEIEKREGTPTAAHLRIVLSAIVSSNFSSNGR
jgi:hypothetical protein